MKKIIILIISVIVFLSILFTAIELPKYRFGYFVKGPEMTYRHGGTPFKLANGNVFIPGINNSVTYGKPTYIPAEIYETDTDSFKILELPKDIIYTAHCFLLQNNRILLSESHKPEDSKNIFKVSPSKESDLLNQMTILNLNTMKIERIIDKKITKYDKYYRNTLHSILLNNGKFLILNSEGKKYIEIFDLDKGTSKLITDNKTDISLSSKVIPYNKDDALIFNTNGTIEKFNSVDEKIYKAGKFTPRTSFNIFKTNEENILIIGGTNNLDIELYNTKTNSSQIIGKLLKGRTKRYSNSSENIAIGNIGDYVIIAGGYKPHYSNFTYNSLKGAEVINYKTHKQYEITNMPFAMHAPNAVKLNDDSLLITSNCKRSVIFKNLIRR